jgi:DNA-binding Xre family transcriptional regulator/molecular chaperone GrpE (heat shock protein)
MFADAGPDLTLELRSHMQRVGITSFKSLSQHAGVSEYQIRLLRQGAIARVRLETLFNLSTALHIEVGTLWALCSPAPPPPVLAAPAAVEPTALRQEYDRIQNQLQQQRGELQQEFQHASLQILESLILQLPTVIHAAEQNPQWPATKLLPLLRPIDRLLENWGIKALAPVGAIVPYDPRYHQLLDGHAQPNDAVKIRYTGYQQGEILLYRAKVSPVANPTA